jgi:Flp pilus assembly protein TadB
MSEKEPNGKSPTEASPEQEAIQADIERTRQDLAETVDQLTDKLDVKARAHDKVAEVRHDASEQLHRMADRATDEQGRPRPPVLAVAAGVALAVVMVVVIRRRRRSR